MGKKQEKTPDASGRAFMCPVLGWEWAEGSEMQDVAQTWAALLGHKIDTVLTARCEACEKLSGRKEVKHFTGYSKHWAKRMEDWLYAIQNVPAWALDAAHELTIRGPGFYDVTLSLIVQVEQIERAFLIAQESTRSALGSDDPARGIPGDD